MVKAAELLGVSDMSCVANALYLVVAVTLFKAKQTQVIGSFQHGLTMQRTKVSKFPENEENELLSRDDRTAIARLRDLAILDMDAYLNETIIFVTGLHTSGYT
ncbi:hypothetical protein JG687_00010653 [Phytophthora cactorum]|uniref:Uncharacterized protein n=1 Tax=Phytophthora cactorum TaxID=29920 RepID=A0A8T1U8H4_9STRA|nr:hypothetical protein JG687_00010653 [Phytophthora cactorum]